MFAHLHVHSEHSTLDGFGKLEQLFVRAAADGQTHLAITDHHSLGSLWRAQRFADQHGITLVPGTEAYIAIGSRLERDRLELSSFDASTDKDKRRTYYHLTLLAMNPAGWQNLLAIQLEGTRNVAGRGKLIDWQFLEQHNAGLMALTGCLGGPVLTHLAAGDEAGAIANLDRLQAIFGPRVAIEVMEHGIGAEARVLPRLAEIAAERGMPLVATNDCHYADAGQADTHDAWLASSTASKLSDPSRYRFQGDGYHLATEAEMRAKRDEPWWQEAVSNAGTLAARVTGRVLPSSQIRFPAVDVPEPFASSEAYLWSQVRDGLRSRFPGGIDDDVKDRVRHEWSTITSMGFVDYFLLVTDLMQWARAHDVPTGAGRGSAAGSMVAYALEITDLDPIEHDLLFERFLEPGRAELPDIDLDFASSHRDQAIAYLRERYGSDRVAHIGNVMTLGAKQALLDAARVLDAAKFGRLLADAVPDQTSLRAFLEIEEAANSEYRRLLADSTVARAVSDLALQFDGVVRGNGVHASGIVIAPQPLIGLVPLRYEDGALVCEWDMNDIADFGLVKLDVLGLRNLTIADVAMRSIDGLSSVRDIPEPDTQGDPRVDAAWQLLQAGRTQGVFQLESPKMTELIRDVRPDTWNDLSAVIALYRPGPLSGGIHTLYADRKRGFEEVDYSVFTDDPDEQSLLEEVLGDTYGLPIYQESLMAIGGAVAGFDDVWRSKLRKAVSKKNDELMRTVGERFIEDAQRTVLAEDDTVIKIGFQRRTAERLWDAMKGAGSYAFNRAHSAAYGKLTFQTAYLKANWPAIYGAAILEVTDGADKRRAAIRSLRGEGIDILEPDVNVAGVHTQADGDGAVRYGLAEIRGVGDGVAEAIVAEREDGGPFSSPADLIDRVRVPNTSGDLQALRGNVKKSLILSGALDAFGPRKALYAAVNLWPLGISTIGAEEWQLLERAQRQRQTIGVVLGTHPARSVATALEQAIYVNPRGFDNPCRRLDDALAAALPSGTPVTVTGILSHWQEVVKAGKTPRAMFTLEDEHSSIDGIMWLSSEAAQAAARRRPPVGWPVIISGSLESRTFDVDGGVGERSNELRAFDVVPIAASVPAASVK